MRSFRKYRKTAIILIIISAFAASLYVTGFSLNVLGKRGYKFFEFIGNLFPPDYGYGMTIVSPLIKTVQMSLAGTAIGAFFALFTSFLSAKNITPYRAIRIPVKIVVQCVRTIPVLIIALIATFIFGIGTFAGTISLALYTWAILTRIGSDDIENMSVSAFEALRVAGTGRAKAFVRTILVEIIPGYVSNALYLLETNVRHASILGYVGAGGIGLLLNEKISWREYSKVGMILLGLFLSVVVIEGISSFLSAVIKGDMRINKRFGYFIGTVVVIAGAWSIFSIDAPNTSALGMGVAGSILNGMIHPDFNYLFDFTTSGVPFLLLETLSIAVAGTIIGAIVAIILSFLNSCRFLPRVVAYTFRLVVMAIRCIPVLIYGIIFLRVCGPGSFAGVLTIAITSVGLITKRFTIAVDRMDMSAWEAYKSMGIGLLGRIKYCVIPQLLTQYLSAVLYRFDVNIRGASILGLVGAGGIGAPLIMYMNQYRWDAVSALIIGLLIMVLLVELISSKFAVKEIN